MRLAEDPCSNTAMDTVIKTLAAAFLKKTRPIILIEKLKNDAFQEKWCC
jgi:hypothetical protein